MQQVKCEVSNIGQKVTKQNKNRIAGIMWLDIQN